MEFTDIFFVLFVLIALIYLIKLTLLAVAIMYAIIKKRMYAIVRKLKWIKTKNYYSWAYSNRGDLYFAKEDYNKIIEDFNQVIQLNPKDAEAYYNRGVAHYKNNVYYKKDEYDEAIADFSQAIKLKQDYANAYYNRGKSYYHKGDYNKAIADFTQAICLNPNDEKSKQFLEEAQRAKDNKLSRFKKICSKLIQKFINFCILKSLAMESKNTIIKVDSNDASGYYKRGNTYLTKGDYDKAIADFNQAINIDPNYAWAYVKRGNAYLTKGDYDKAIEDYNQAINIDPNYAWAYSRRGYTYTKKNDYDKAIEDYDFAIYLSICSECVDEYAEECAKERLEKVQRTKMAKQ